MSMLSALASLFTRAPAPVEVKAARHAMKININAAAEMGVDAAVVRPWVAPQIAPGVLPKDGPKLAMDSTTSSVFNWANGINTTFAEGIQFMGYPYLAELTQRSEYRKPAEILAKNMTRKWLKFHATGEDDKSAKIKALEAEFERLDVKSIVRKSIEVDGYFGRAQIYIDLGVGLDDRDEIDKPIAMTSAKIPRDSLKALRIIEPMWTYPNNYNSVDPLAPDFYHPTSWFVMGTNVHASRLLTVIGRPLPDMLKPAYAFGGLSLSQMAKPYVDNWLRTRQSVSDLLHSFTVWVLKTDLGMILNNGSAAELKKRLMLFNKTRDVRGAFVVDKENEEFDNVSAPLAGLDALQAQTQEHMSAVTGIPLSILLGITPTGLNASNEGEIRTFYDWIEAQQEATLTPHVQYIMNVAQLSLFGEIDEQITFSWNPLWTMSDKERGEIAKQEAETDGLYFDMGALDSTEVRTRLANKEDSPYAGIDVDKVIQQPDEEHDVDLPGGGDGALDADFEEGKHPRGEGGKFGAGSGSGALPAGVTKQRIKVPGEGSHTEVTFPNGKKERIVRLNSSESMGLPGWHDMSDMTNRQVVSYLADTEEEAIKALAKKHA